RRRHTRSYGDWSSDVCSSDLPPADRVVGVGDLSRRWALGTDVVPREVVVRIAGGAVGAAKVAVAAAVEGTTGMAVVVLAAIRERSEERRVGKERRGRWARCCE